MRLQLSVRAIETVGLNVQLEFFDAMFRRAFSLFGGTASGQLQQIGNLALRYGITSKANGIPNLRALKMAAYSG
ncbi:hypothetical protein [Leptothermofonsia sp. ETS-13]|uniref:hypothetical protein n=1 Tax=Leptothermofonsia sp. ETS-13 TaxID=3035696 RepID=UPI003B9FF75F